MPIHTAYLALDRGGLIAKPQSCAAQTFDAVRRRHPPQLRPPGGGKSRLGPAPAPELSPCRSSGRYRCAVIGPSCAAPRTASREIPDRSRPPRRFRPGTRCPGADFQPPCGGIGQMRPELLAGRERIASERHARGIRSVVLGRERAVGGDHAKRCDRSKRLGSDLRQRNPGRSAARNVIEPSKSSLSLPWRGVRRSVHGLARA